MKINIGSGYERFDGFINIDHDKLVQPDYVINLDDVNVKLPFDDNSITEIKAHHILEHIGAAFIPLMKELYRVAANECILDIVVPNENHANWYNDPTHVRHINVNIMNKFSKKAGLDSFQSKRWSNTIAFQYDIDFEVVAAGYDYDEFYQPMLEDFFKRKESNQVTPEEDFMVYRLLREANNVIVHNKIIMKAVK